MNTLDELIRSYAERLKTQPDYDSQRCDPAPPESPGRHAAEGPGSTPGSVAAPPGAGVEDANAEDAADRRVLHAAPVPQPAGPVPKPPSHHDDLEVMAQVDPEGAALHRQWRDKDQIQKAAVVNEYYRKMRRLKGLPDAEIERELTPLERKFVFPFRPERNLPEFSGTKSPVEAPLVPTHRESAPHAESKDVDPIETDVNKKTKGVGSASPSGRTLARRPPPERREQIAPPTRRRRGPVE